VSSSKTTVPPFFTAGTYRSFLRKDDKVLVVPFGRTGESMLWQADSLMYFSMAGGWLGPEPVEFQHWPIVQGFLSSVLMPEADVQLKAFLARCGVETVLLGDSNRNLWTQLFSKIDRTPIRIGGITIYQVVPAALDEFRHIDALQAEGQANLARFREMLLATSLYLRRGGDPAKLNCARAQELGLMPDRGESRAASNQLGWCYSMWFGPIGGNSIGIGLIGYYAGLKPVIGRYGQFANNILYPYPDKIIEESDPDRLGALMLTFDRAGLALATAAASKTTASTERPRDSLTRRLGGDVIEPASSTDAARGIPQPRSLPQAARFGSAASERKSEDSPAGSRPVVSAVNGTAVSNNLPERSRKGTSIEPVVPAGRASWGPWWREVEADDVVVIDGHGFDTQDGVAVDLYCNCPGGEVGPFFFEPNYHPFSGTQIFLKVPVYGANAPREGRGSIVVSNKGKDGQYTAKSNRVPVWIGNHN